jgi:hypothetical protein
MLYLNPTLWIWKWYNVYGIKINSSTSAQVNTDYHNTYFHMPVFSECSHHTLLNWSSASTANGNTHFVMAAQTVQLILKAIYRPTHLSPLTQPAIRTHYCFNKSWLETALHLLFHWQDRSSNPGGGKNFLTCSCWPQGPPNLLYEGYQVSYPGVSNQGMALTTHSLLVLTFKKEQSYTYTFPLFLHGTLYSDLYLYVPFHWLQTQDDCVLLEPLNWVPHHMLYSWSGSHDKPHLGNAMAYHQSAHWNNQMHSFEKHNFMISIFMYIFVAVLNDCWIQALLNSTQQLE